MSTEPPFVPYGRQWIDASDADAVLRVLHSDWLTQGPAIEEFEAGLCALTGAPHAVAMANATAALHIACLSLGVGPGDMVWTSPNSFIASANCARYCGADVDFVDIDPVTMNMSVEALAAKLGTAELTGTLPKVVIPVHFSGQSCDMVEIAALAARYGFRTIEDASHAVGAWYQDTRVGSCAYSDIAVFSFHPVKIVTTAEGGAALTRNPELAQRLALLRSHGMTRDTGLMENESEGGWDYDQIALGYNYRITDLQASLGSSQLRRVDDFVTRRHAIADIYDTRLADLPLTLPVRLTDRISALHLYVIQLDDPARRRATFDALRAARIGANVHYIPIHTQPYYRRLGFAPGDFPAAEHYYARAITIPMHPRLDDTEIDRVVNTLEQFLT